MSYILLIWQTLTSGRVTYLMHLTNIRTNKAMRPTSLSQIDSCQIFTALIEMSRSANSQLTLSDISFLISKPFDVVSSELSTKNNNDKRFSFLSANPSERMNFYCSSEIKTWQQSTQKNAVTEANTPFDNNAAEFKEKSQESRIPFHSGWIGYFSYPRSTSNTAHNTATNIPTKSIAEFNYYPWSICFDHSLGQFHLLGKPDQAAKEAYAWLLAELSNQRTNKLIAQPQASSFLTTPFIAAPFIARWQKSDYKKAFDRVQDYLLAGDCYQVNLTHPFVSSHYEGSAIDTIQPLASALKPNFGCYFQGKDCELVSMSPERFMSINSSGVLEAKPIKGTIKRGEDSALDKALIAELSNSAKNKAENLMIVDLLRNDLSMSAIPGSVKVDKLFELESHPNVHHLVSTISAQLKPEISPAEAINSAFPGGSITGAPKKRAMEIIEELEVQPRSLYCGSFGYFSDTGNADFNILIRSLEFRDNTITCWGGGGITVDSDCDEEYEESLTKIQRIMDVIEGL